MSSTLQTGDRLTWNDPWGNQRKGTLIFDHGEQLHVWIDGGESALIKRSEVVEITPRSSAWSGMAVGAGAGAIGAAMQALAALREHGGKAAQSMRDTAGAAATKAKDMARAATDEFKRKSKPKE